MELFLSFGRIAIWKITLPSRLVFVIPYFVRNTWLDIRLSYKCRKRKINAYTCNKNYLLSLITIWANRSDHKGTILTQILHRGFASFRYGDHRWIVIFVQDNGRDWHLLFLRVLVLLFLPWKIYGRRADDRSDGGNMVSRGDKDILSPGNNTCSCSFNDVAPQDEEIMWNNARGSSIISRFCFPAINRDARANVSRQERYSVS